MERLEQYLTANSVTEEKKKVAVLVTVMGTKALHNLVAPNQSADKKSAYHIQSHRRAF